MAEYKFVTSNNQHIPVKIKFALRKLITFVLCISPLSSRYQKKPD